MAIELKSPLTEDAARRLRVGDRVSLSGVVFTVRDRLHRHLAGGGEIPVSLKGAVIFHCGPVVMRREGGWHVTAAGPTMSIRQDIYLADVLRRHDIRAVIGAGGMGAAATAVFQKAGCVYLHAVGGTATLHAARVEAVEAVHLLREMGPTEAMWELRVQALTAVVTIDTHGGNMHRQVEDSSRAVLERLMRKLRRSRRVASRHASL